RREAPADRRLPPSLPQEHGHHAGAPAGHRQVGLPVAVEVARDQGVGAGGRARAGARGDGAAEGEGAAAGVGEDAHVERTGVGDGDVGEAVAVEVADVEAIGRVPGGVGLGGGEGERAGGEHHVERVAGGVGEGEVGHVVAVEVGGDHVLGTGAGGDGG